MTLWDGARRLAYFFTYAVEEPATDGAGMTTKEYVLCPQCTLEHQGEFLTAYYTTLTSVMCCRCGIVMGPINQAEMEKAE